MKSYYELFVTKDTLTLSDWDILFKEISRLNSVFGSWKLYLLIENNMLRFYIQSKVKIPSILSSSSCFVIKEIDAIDTLSKLISKTHICMESDKTFGDIYDKFESQSNKVLKQIEIKFKYITSNRYYTKTHLYFKKSNNKKTKYRSFFFIPAYH